MTEVADRTPKGRLDPRRRREDIRARLLAAVENLAAEGVPYSTVTVERLAMAAGISRATFYIYFASKADLAEAWLAATLTDMAQAASAWQRLSSAPSQERLTLVLGDVIETYAAHGALLVAVQDEATQNLALQEQLTSAADVAIDAIRHHIETGQAGGWVDAGLCPAETAAWLFWMFERGLRQLVTGADGPRRRALRDNLASVLWHVLYGRRVGSASDLTFVGQNEA